MMHQGKLGCKRLQPRYFSASILMCGTLVNELGHSMHLHCLFSYFIHLFYSAKQRNSHRCSQ